MHVLLIGWARVSKSDGSQTVAPQRDVLRQAGVAPERIDEDLACGRDDARPGLAACLKALQQAIRSWCANSNSLGRDLRHLVNTVEDLRVRGVGLKVLAGAGARIDTTTANARLAFGILAAFAEFERELIAQRTHAGLAAARARGRMGGVRAMQSMQDLLLKLALQMARDDYETRRDRQRVQLAKAASKYTGRVPDTATHERIVALRRTGLTITRTAEND